jgi:thiamine biosynthesis lipoprotein
LHSFIALCSIMGIAAIFIINRLDPLNTVSRDGVALDTVISVTASAPKSISELNGILNDAFALIEELDDRFSMYNENSDVSLMSANAGGEWVPVSRPTYEALAAAVHAAKLTDGAYDPTIGPVSIAWRDRLSENSLPSEEEIDAALLRVSFDALELSSSPPMAKLDMPGGVVDLGGIAKGYVSSSVRNLLKERGVTSALIDLGGNVVVIGGRPRNGSGTRTPWRIGVQHPSKPRGTPICVVSLSEGSVITAGDYERFWEVDGGRYTHIYNPATGFPVDGRLKSVTIISDDPTQGDALSTAFIVMGEPQALELLRIMPEVGAIFISETDDEEYRITATGDLKGAVETTPGGPHIAFHDTW